VHEAVWRWPPSLHTKLVRSPAPLDLLAVATGATEAPSASDRSGLGLTPEPSMPGAGAALPVGGAPPDWTVPLVASVTVLLGLLGLAAMLLPA
jgi:hypothetical protein